MTFVYLVFLFLGYGRHVILLHYYSSRFFFVIITYFYYFFGNIYIIVYSLEVEAF